MSDSREVADCYLFLNIALPLSTDKQRAVDFFLFGWIFDNLAKRCDIEQSFMRRDDFLTKFAHAIESDKPEAVLDTLSKLKALLRAKFGESDYGKMFVIVAGWFARAIELRQRPDLALFTLLEFVNANRTVDFPINYLMARFIGSINEKISLKIVSPYWTEWGGNWKNSVDKGSLNHGMLVILQNSINQFPVFYFLVDYDTALTRNRKEAHEIRQAKDWERFNARGKIESCLLDAEGDIKNLEMYSNIKRLGLLEKYFRPGFDEKIVLAGDLLKKISSSEELKLIRDARDSNDFLTLVRTYPLACEFSKDVRNAYRAVRAN